MAANQTFALFADRAEVVTCTVTIQALRIDGKQMTQAIFKQLPNCELVDPVTITITGEIWGWVHVRDAEPESRRIYIVLRDGLLCRTTFRPLFFADLRSEGLGYGNQPATTRWFSDSSHPWNTDPGYPARWDLLMNQLRAVPQLFIGA